MNAAGEVGQIPRSGEEILRGSILNLEGKGRTREAARKERCRGSGRASVCKLGGQDAESCWGDPTAACDTD